MVSDPLPFKNKSVLHTDYRIGGGAEPRDDGAKFKLGVLPALLDDDVLIDKCVATLICMYR